MATTEEIVARARDILHTDTRFWNSGHPMFIALEYLTEDQLTELVERAATDFRTHEYLRAWLASELAHAVPEQLPRALTPFVRRLAAGTGPDGRGKKMPTLNKALLSHCAEILKEEFDCAAYKADLTGTACDYIAQALNMTPARIKRILGG